jgi:hypothetical protein
MFRTSSSNTYAVKCVKASVRAATSAAGAGVGGVVDLIKQRLKQAVAISEDRE